MKLEEIKIGEKKGPSMAPIMISAIVFPMTVLFWVLNHFFPIITTATSGEFVTPGRWFMSFFAPVIISAYGYRRKSLNVSGTVFALFVGFFLTISSYCFLTSLLIFFLSSSRATKFRSSRKKKIEEDFKEGGQRNWIQVICNGGMATQLAILYLVDVGFGERPIDFLRDYRASWLGVAILGSLTCANGDTWASELGSVTSTSTPRLITTLRRVPSGTNGAVTLGGLIFSALGGLVVGLGYYLTVIFLADEAILGRSPPQWPIIIVGTMGGLLGSLIDSLIGATLQYSGSDAKGKIHEVPGAGIKHISGYCLLDNHSVNLISTILTGLILPQIAMLTFNYS